MTRPSFSLTSWAEAERPFSVEIDGEVHVARPVSRMALLKFHGAVAVANGDAAAEERALRVLLRVAFPVRFWRYLLNGRRDPVERILGLGLAAREALLLSFFAALTPEQAGESGPKSLTGDAASSGARRPLPSGSAS